MLSVHTVYTYSGCTLHTWGLTALYFQIPTPQIPQYVHTITTSTETCHQTLSTDIVSPRQQETRQIYPERRSSKRSHCPVHFARLFSDEDCCPIYDCPFAPCIPGERSFDGCNQCECFPPGKLLCTNNTCGERGTNNKIRFRTPQFSLHILFGLVLKF